MDEYERRLANYRPENTLHRQSEDFRQNCYLATWETSNGNIVNVDKYDALADRWDQFQKIRLPEDRKHLGIIIAGDLILIIGGTLGMNFVTDVS